MTSIGDVAAALHAAVATAEEAAEQLRTADERIENALAPLQAALADSSNSDTHDGLGSLTTARQRLSEALAAIKTGSDRMRAPSDRTPPHGRDTGASRPASSRIRSATTQPDRRADHASDRVAQAR